MKFYNIVSIFQTYLGGFITRGGTLAGLAFKYQKVRNANDPIKFYFLPVDGNHPLMRYLKNDGIQIKDIDSSGSSNN